MMPVTSADGKLTLTKTASPTSLPYGGGTVTYTYTVKNNTAGRMYYDGLSDNKCRPSYVSGMSYSWFSGDYIPAGGTATFSCTQRITTDTTNTATASFSNVSGIQSSVSATATVTVARPATGNTSCDFIYASTVYLSGTNGTGSVSIWPNATGIDMPTSYTVGGVVADSSTALAIDPLNPNTAYLTLRTEDGVYYPYLMKVDLSTGIWTRIDVTNSTPAAWGSNRLAVDRYGHVWSLANDGVLFEYDPVAGTTTTHGIPRTLTATNPDGTSVTIDFGTLSSGDIAFDGDNNLWILAANGTTNTTYLVTIPYASLDAGTGTTRTTGPTATYLGTVTNPANGGYYNGLAFATNGTLYASNYSGSTSYLYTLNSATGASTLVGTGVTLDGVIGDLASCAIPKPNLLVTKTADKDLVQAGEQITYTVKITNTSPLASTGTTFVDPLPANTTYVSSTFNGTAITGTTNPWQSAREVHGTSTTRAGLLPGGDTATITITVKVNSPLPAGTTN